MLDKTLTKGNYERYLNENGVPDHEKERVGRRIKYYGLWLRRNDPIQFEIGYREWFDRNKPRHPVWGGRDCYAGQ